MSKLANERYEARKRIQELEGVLKSLIADIEAMQTSGNWFGPFEMMKIMSHEIEWPNLRILLDQAKQKLKGGK